jgi:hypothetical protein
MRCCLLVQIAVSKSAVETQMMEPQWLAARGQLGSLVAVIKGLD